VVTYKGQLAYPVTVTPLPFASSVPPGTTPVVPQTGKIVASTATGQAQAWAAEVFGPSGRPVDGLGYSLAGHVTVLNQWIPVAGAALVARVSVPLAGIPPGPPGSRAVAADQRVFTAEGDAFRSAHDDVTQPNNSAQAAMAAANALTADQQAQDAAAAALSSARQPQATDTATLTTTTGVAAETVTSVYDVAFDAQGQPIAWAPADYQIGHRR